MLEHYLKEANMCDRRVSTPTSQIYLNFLYKAKILNYFLKYISIKD